MDSAISSVIHNKYKADDPDRFLHVESWEVLEKGKSYRTDDPDKVIEEYVKLLVLHESMTYVKLLVLHENMTQDEIGFTDADGGYELAELHFSIEDDGFYKLKDCSFTEADGQEYEEYQMRLMRSNYDKALKAYGIDPDELAEKLLNAIISEKSASSNPNDYIEAHKTEYGKLVLLGDHTLRYIYGCFLDGGETGLKGRIMERLLNEIWGDMLKCETSNGQEYFDAVLSYARRIGDLNGMDYMQENEPALYLLLTMADER